MNLLDLGNLTKSYRGAGRPAVRDATFAVGGGELLALVGESGSGKTTLLRLIAGLETPDQGTIALDGATISAPGRCVPAERRGIGMVFQHHALFPHLTVAANIGFGIRRLPRNERRDAVASLLERVGLPGFAGRYPHQLSGGERQRVALARALAPRPRLLLLDEPFASLDPRLRQSLRDESRRVLKHHGTTAILVTHDTADALAVADRIVVLREGVIQQHAGPSEIYGRPANRYVAAFFGDCNFIPGGLLPGHGHIGPASEDGLWVRPDGLALAEATEGAAAGFAGTVVAAGFRGSHLEVVLECAGGPGGRFQVAVRHPPGLPVAAGETRTIVLRETSSAGLPIR